MSTKQALYLLIVICPVVLTAVFGTASDQMMGGRHGMSSMDISVEVDKLVSEEMNQPTTEQNVKERFEQFAAILRMLGQRGYPLDKIISRDETMRIKSLIYEGMVADAVEPVHRGIMRLKDDDKSSRGFPQRGNFPVNAVPKGASGSEWVSPVKLKKPVTAVITVDTEKELGPFSDHLFGTLAGPTYDEDGLALAQKGGFKLIQVQIDIIKWDASRLNDFELSVRSVLSKGMTPLVWLMLQNTVPSDFNQVNQNVSLVLNRLKVIDPNHDFIFRIGNEPDEPSFWHGSQDEFFQLFEVISKTVKAFNKRYAVGGPGFQTACINKKIEGIDCSGYNDWLTKFLEYCRKKSVPVDYVSIHGYAPLAYSEFYRQYIKFAELVQNYPTLSPLYGRPKLGNDEWNLLVGDLWSGSYHEQFDTTWAAVSNALAWISMIDNNLWLSVRYGGTSNILRRGDPGNGHDFPLTNPDGSGKPAYFAFKALNTLTGMKRLGVSGGDYINIAAIAGKGDDGSISVVLANFDFEAYLLKYYNIPAGKRYKSLLNELNRDSLERYDAYKVVVRNLPWKSGDRVSYEIYSLDDSNRLNVIDKKIVGGAMELTVEGKMSTPSLFLLNIRKDRHVQSIPLP